MGALEGGRRGERAGEGGLGHVKQLQGVGGGGAASAPPIYRTYALCCWCGEGAFRGWMKGKT